MLLSPQSTCVQKRSALQTRRMEFSSQCPGARLGDTSTYTPLFQRYLYSVCQLRYWKQLLVPRLKKLKSLRMWSCDARSFFVSVLAVPRCAASPFSVARGFGSLLPVLLPRFLSRVPYRDTGICTAAVHSFWCCHLDRNRQILTIDNDYFDEYECRFDKEFAHGDVSYYSGAEMFIPLPSMRRLARLCPVRCSEEGTRGLPGSTAPRASMQRIFEFLEENTLET